MQVEGQENPAKDLRQEGFCIGGHKKKKSEMVRTMGKEVHIWKQKSQESEKWDW